MLFRSGKDLEKLKEYYKNLAQKYKNNCYVWFDIMNEPGNNIGPKNEQAWLNEHQQILKIFKEEKVENIVLVEDLDYATAAQKGLKKSCIFTYGKMLKEIYPNVVFSLHGYGGWTEKKWDQVFEKAKKEGLPIVIGEYGCANDRHYSLKWADTFLKSAKKHDIGRLAWKWYGGEPYMPWGMGEDRNLFTKAGKGGGWNTVYDSLEKPTNLTGFGKIVWSDTHSK